MIQKRNVIYMFILTAAVTCLAGCTGPNAAKANTPANNPVISAPATATPAGSSEDGSTPTPVPPTSTPEPTATPTPTPTPTPIPTVPPAPVTVNTDTSTIDFLINRDYPLTEGFRPDDLVVPDIPFAFSDKTLDKRKLKKVAAEALEELYQTALEEEGLTIYGVSGYRSYDRQYDIYGENLITRGIRHTNLYSAAPGNSEHQTGLAIDVSCKSINFKLNDDFATTPEGLWLKENCWRFGLILRYQKDKERITGYAYEPWHIRYVGIPLAYYLYTNNLSLEEYYGCPSSHTLAELEDRPLIDMHTERFYQLYAKTFDSELLYKEDGSFWISETTGYPMIKEPIRDANGNLIKANGTGFFIEPVYDENGNYILDELGNLLYTKPYFDAEGSLWLDYNNSPVYLQPLWNADGTLAKDAFGNLLYTEPLLDPMGFEVITETGSLITKVPVRDAFGELTYHPDGSVIFYEPYVVDDQFILDSTTGLPLYPPEYYEVPNNTLPLPKEEISFPEEVPEDTFTEDEFYEDNYYWDDYYQDDNYWDDYYQDNYYDTTDETGGFFE